MAKEKEAKLLTIQRLNPALYQKVMNSEMSITDAYNEAKKIQLGLSEFRGTNTKKKEFATDFRRIIKLHDPSIEEVVDEFKRAFPLTWKEYLKS